jgi:transcriptional regulator with XRE-family HTH domain
MAGVGEQLRQARLKQGIDLKEAENTTKIRLRYLEAMENEEFSVLPGRVYVIGFLRTYAKFLNIESEKLIDALKAAYPDRGLQPEPIPKPSIPLAKPLNKFARRIFWLIFFALFAIIAIVAFYYAAGFFGQVSEKAVPQLPAKDISETGDIPYLPVEVPPAPVQIPDKPNIELIVIIERDQSWISVEDDGERGFRGIMAAGQQLVIQADNLIRINFGNAGAVRVFKNNEDQGNPGELGQVVTIEYRAEDLERR